VRLVRRAIPLLVVSLAAACGGSGGTTIPADVGSVLSVSASVMGQIESVRFEIERTGDSVYLDPGGTLAFQSADGRFVSPSSADATVTLNVAGLTTRVGAVAIDGQTWLSNPITGSWEPAPAGYSFDPATLFDPDTGWRPLLDGGFTSAELVGTETIDGAASYHLTGVASGPRVTSITAGLVDSGDVDADLWIDQHTGQVLEVTFSVPVPDGTATWKLTFSEYGGDFEVSPPDLDG
jgi:LppX_LprAFG lipoprotein